MSLNLVIRLQQTIGNSSTRTQILLGSSGRSIARDFDLVGLDRVQSHPAGSFGEFQSLEDCLGKRTVHQAVLDYRRVLLVVQARANFQGKLGVLDKTEEMERIDRLMEMLLEESIDMRLDCQFVLEMDRIAWLVGGPCPTVNC
jgi:hypothetical protein